MLEQVKTRPSPLGDAIRVENDRVTVVREADLTSAKMDAFVREAVFGTGDARDYARWLIWEIGEAVGVRPASINGLYMARGKGAVRGFTVPAINVRGAAYDTARAIFRTAIKLNAGAFLLEIARSEIGYTDQRPSEYVAVMLGAALREGFRGPVFIQGDHFQVNAKKFAVDPNGEVAAVKQLALEAVTAGFYNIDVDTSTLVDLSKPDTLFYIPGVGFPFNPLPLFMGVTMLWQARLTPVSPTMDPVQQKMMKYMPLMFMVFLYNFSAGLTLYWTVQNLLSILQTKLTKSNQPVTPVGPQVSSALTPQSKKKK